MRLRRRLTVLVAIALTPPFLLTLYNTARWQVVLDQEARDEALATARLFAAELGEIIDGSGRLMLAMSKHPAVPDQENECVDYFKSVIAEIPLYREAAVIDSHGVFHCSTIAIPPGLDVRDRIYFHETLETGRLTVGTLVQGRVTHADSIHISLPYRYPDGTIKGMVVLILDPEKLAQHLSARPWQARHQLIVMDRTGSLVLTIPQREVANANAIAKNIFPRVAKTPAETLDAPDVEGQARIIGFAPVRDARTDLFVAIAISRDAALAEARIINARSLGFALITMLLAVAGAWIATHFLINRPIRAIVKTAQQREAGDLEAPFPRLTASTEFGQLSASLARMSDKIQKLVEQKGFLLRELQHRVMNSLAMLASVLEMQRRYVREDSARKHLGQARDRVIAMGTVYRFLYQTETSEQVEFSDFLKIICAESQNAYASADNRVIQVSAEPLQLSSSHAIALAMLTHELITNALKHAYPDAEPGVISVTLTNSADGGVDLRVADRGRGLPPDFQIGESVSLGMRVISSTVTQLGGALEINRLEPGTEFVIRLPAAILDAKTE